MRKDSILAVLSLDLLILILDRLPSSGDRKTFRLVSRAFFRAEILHRRSLRVLRRESLFPLLRRYFSLESLDLSLCPPLCDDALAAGFSSIGFRSGLRSLNLSRASGVGWRALEAAVAAFPRLEAVDLSHCVGIGDREAAAVAGARGLKELRLDKCLEVTDVGLAKVAVGCGKLERLGLKWCLEISDIGIDLMAKKCRELRGLDVSYLKVTNKALCSISSLEKLEDLSMVGCSYIDDEGLAFLNNGNKSLRSIDVSRCDNISSSGLISVIKGHKSLQKLSIADCFPELAPLFLYELSVLKATLNTIKLDGFQVSTSSLRIIGLNCKNLVEVSLSKCQGVTDEGISELVTNCTNLITVDLTCCHLLTDKALSAIANHCQKLEHLRLESCSLITEKGLDRIGTCCSELKEVDLTDCSINDTALKCLSRCSKLMVLKLGLCQSITNEGLAHIGSNCRNLRELDLYRCVEVSDDGLASVAIGCKKLKKLNLCYCSQITDQGMKHIASLEELIDLEMRGLYEVTSEGIAAIAHGCKSLAELDMKRCGSVEDAGLSALARYSQNLRQINVSYCPVSGAGLYELFGNLRCLQDAKLVHLTRVSIEGFELSLRASCGRLKKLKLLSGLRFLLSPLLLQMLQAQRCRIRWVEKPLILGLG